MPFPLRPACALAGLWASLALAGCASAVPGAPVGPTPPASPLPATVEEPPAPPPPARRDLLGAVAYDLPMEANGWVEQEVDFLVGQRHEVIGRWMERADPYERFVKGTLARYGIPTDLHHLAMIESGFVPTIRSRAGAVGLWQFMPATGRGMGLRIDEWTDERMDPVRSTDAAARHLRSLFRELGDWSLAAAAYNAGSGRITRGLRSTGSRDFWELSARGTLAAETRQYVPRLYAMTIIARDRGRWGFPSAGGAVRPFSFDSVEVDLATPLAELARIGRVPVDQLAALNPHLLRGSTPPGRYWVWTPRGSGPAVQAAFQSSDFRAWRGVAAYTVRPGEDLLTLAGLAGTSAERLRELNPALGSGGANPGDRLLLPRPAAERLAARPQPIPAVAVEPEPAPAKPAASPQPVAAPAPAAVRLHTVAGGETLLGIAERYRVAFTEVMAENGMETAEVHAGQALRLPAAATSGEPVPAPAPKQTAPKSAAPPEHVVQSGETLWGIARRYDVTVPALWEANGMAEEAVIRPGQTLRIPR